MVLIKNKPSLAESHSQEINGHHLDFGYEQADSFIHTSNIVSFISNFVSSTTSSSFKYGTASYEYLNSKTNTFN